MSNKIIFIQEGDENPCLSCTTNCNYPCEAKQQWVLGGGIKGPKRYYKRSEAVERMANVFYDFCEGGKTYEGYEHLAAAALDALVNK